jgi:Squalene-hopene cyclase C-terminal domain/Prenyltransferase and squalene oxidase repeat
MSSTHSQIGAAAGKVKRDLWLNGDVLACACPDCGGPMSVRVWLMMADCPSCAASIELTPEQRRQAERLLGQRLEAAKPAVASSAAPGHQASPPPNPPPAAPPKKPHIPVAKLVKTGPSIPPPLPPPSLAPPRYPPPLPTAIARSLAPNLKQSYTKRGPRRPYWTIALLSLCAIGAAYALWSLLHRGDNSTPIVANHSDAAPEKKLALPPSKWQAKRESRPVATAAHPGDLKAERAADELTVRRDGSAGFPELSKVIAAVKTPSATRMLEGRDPRIRTDVVEEEGGSVYTEAAVAAGLRWLARHQSGDGRWSLDRFSSAGDCDGQCDGEGIESDTAGTALALLPFLGAGQSQKQGLHQEAVDRGLKWLVSRQRRDGSLMGSGGGRMYAHGLATIVLCEALAMSGDDSLRPAAQRAIDFIVRAQHEEGGWRYHPGDEGDTSVVGWQLMALQSGKIAYLDVPKSTFERAGRFLDTVRGGRHGGLFAYQPGRGPSPAMTAEGLLCRQYLGWQKENLGLREGINRLLKEALPREDEPNIYYWYYATQVMHHVGGEPWKIWNAAVRDALLSMQEQEGHRAGSWSPRGGAIGDIDSHQGGRIYMTSLALCTLEVYYRYLPLYRGIEVER